MADHTITAIPSDTRQEIKDNAVYKNGIYDLEGDLRINNNLTFTLDRINLVLQGLNPSTNWIGDSENASSNNGRLRVTNSNIVIHNENNRTSCIGADFDNCSVVFTGRYPGPDRRVNGLFSDCTIRNLTTTDGTTGGAEGNLSNSQILRLENRTWTQLSNCKLYRCVLAPYTSFSATNVDFEDSSQFFNSMDGDTNATINMIDCGIIDGGVNSVFFKIWQNSTHANVDNRTYNFLNCTNNKTVANDKEWVHKSLSCYENRTLKENINFQRRYNIQLSIDNPTAPRKMILWGNSATPIFDVNTSTNEFAEQIFTVASLTNFVSGSASSSVTEIQPYKYLNEIDSYDYTSTSGASDIDDEYDNTPSVYSFLIECYGFVAVYENNYHISYVNDNGNKGTRTEKFLYRLEVDTNITKSYSDIQALTTVSTLDDFYDLIRYHEYLNPTKNLVNNKRVTANGSTLDFGAYDIVIDKTLSSAITVTASAISVKSDQLLQGTKFTNIATTGTYSEINNATQTTAIVKDTNGVRVTFNLSNGDIIKGKYGATDTLIPFETVTGSKRITIPENTAITLFVKRDGQREQVISTNSEQGKTIDFSFTALDGAATTLSWINDINVSFVDNADDTLDKLTINFDGTNNIPDLETNMTNTIVNHIQSQEAYADLCLSRNSARFFRIEPNLNMHIFNVDVDFTLDNSIATNINCRIPMYTTNSTIDTPKNTHVDKNLMIFYFLNSSPDIDYNLLQLRVNEASNVVDIKNKVDSMDINALANTQSTILQEIAKVPEMNIGMKINVHESNITVPSGESVYFVVQGSDFEDELGKIRDVVNNTWVTEASANNDVLISTTLVNNYYVADNPVSPCVKRECFVVTHDTTNTFSMSSANIHKTLILGC